MFCKSCMVLVATCTLRGIIDTEAEDFDLTVPTQVIRDHTVGHLK